jgi:hypothetical protein
MAANFTTADFQSLDQFPLAWRWTDTRWNVLPPTVLALIHPFTPAAANTLWQASRTRQAAIDRLSRAAPDVAFLDVPLDDDATVRRWLRNHGILETDDIFVLWNPTTAVHTTWHIFCSYWDDFCYPSSDDVLIYSAAGDWFAAYAHYETFVVGRTR